MILGGAMLLLVWYISLPYDNVMFEIWQKEIAQPERNNYVLQTSSDLTNTSLYGIGNIIEGITEIAVYFVVPSAIIYKIFLTVKRELRLNVGY